VPPSSWIADVNISDIGPDPRAVRRELGVAIVASRVAVSRARAIVNSSDWGAECPNFEHQ
jgi:hypothetical protein